MRETVLTARAPVLQGERGFRERGVSATMLHGAS